MRCERFADDCDALILDALANAPLEQPGHPLLHEGQAVYAILEHEAMHQETMLYMWHQLPYEHKCAPSSVVADCRGATPAPETVSVPAGRATLGARPGEIPFGWDNEFPGVVVDVPAFEIDVHDVTNEQLMDFVDAGGYRQAQWWTPEAFAVDRAGRHRSSAVLDDVALDRGSGAGMFDEIDLPPAWPVYVSQAEAAAYARWKGARLPTEAEYHRAAFAAPVRDERPYPWGDAAPDASRGLFDFACWDPVAVGQSPAGRSAWGVHDLMGNGWEWTCTDFGPFEGFRPMASYPEYSAEFFDGRHKVMKGASPATAPELLRRSFRNWFRPNYPYVYATFRCVRTESGDPMNELVSTDGIDVLRREQSPRVRRGRGASGLRGSGALLPAAEPSPVAFAFPVRPPRLGAVRRDLSLAVVSHHEGRAPGCCERHGATIGRALPGRRTRRRAGMRQRREAGGAGDACRASTVCTRT